MALRVPPPEIPVVSFLTPNKSDQGLLEFWNTELASYVPLDIGAPHPNSRLYPNFHLGRQAPVQGDEKWVMRTWITDETNPDWFNWAGKFAGEDAEFPTFIRTYREPRATYTPRTKGEPLKTLYKTVLTENGNGYSNGAYPSVEFAESTVTPTELAIAHAVVASDGSITEVVLDFGGEGYEANLEFNVSPPISGTPAKGIAYVQPQKVLLTREEASLYPEDSPFYAQYLQVARVYETIPGPTFNETRLDIDGAILNVATTRKFCSDITTGESIDPDTGVWCKTTSKPTDIDVICEEEVACRPIPGNPMESTKVAEDGKIITRTQTYTATVDCVSNEEIDAGVWIKRYIEDVDGTNLVSWQIVESREVPGYPMVGIKIDKDGKSLNEIRTLKDTLTINDHEEITVGGVWLRVGKEAVSDLVAWEVVTARPATGNNVFSANVDGDHEVQNVTALLRPNAGITPSASESGGFITTVEAKEVSDLESEQVTTVGRWLDKAEYAISIINLIPREFMAFIPTFTESHILAGTASMPTLGLGEFEHSKRQLTKLLYEERIVSLGSISLPITHTNQETTEEYGGGVLNVTYTLETQGSGTIDEGLLVTEASLVDLGNGMEVKTTKELDDTAWTQLTSNLWDDNYRVEYTETKQVVDALTSPDPDPGGGVFAWVSEVKAIDKWRSLITNTSKPAPTYDSEANALQSYEYKPYRFPGLLYTANAGYYVRHADAVLVQHLIKTWWLKSPTTPTVTETGGGGDVEIDEIIMDDVVISSLNSTTTLAYSGPVLHDDITTFGALFYPATTPSYTQYALGTPTGTTTENIGTVYFGGTGYAVTDTLTIAAGGFTMSVDVTFVDGTGVVVATTAIDLSGTFPPGSYGPIAATGGGGSGAFFNVFSVNVPTYTPGTEWIGTLRVIGAEVKPEREKDIWKIVTESVVMR